MALRTVATELGALTHLRCRVLCAGDVSLFHRQQQDTSPAPRQLHADTLRSASPTHRSVKALYDDVPDRKVEGAAPFVPPSIQKLINVMIRHGQKEIAQKTVFKTAHVLYNMSRPSNPRPQLKQRHAAFVPVELR